tara:strand:- start:2611 stop:3108 length:498 start_codon:yes stop_codon:yes gene_type:complete
MGQLAAAGHADGLSDATRSVVLLREAINLNHAEATFQLGAVLYTGAGIDENEPEAIAMFALQRHRTIQWLATCLETLSWRGLASPDRDRVRALEMLRRAGELGHRGARSRYLSLLDAADALTTGYGQFTDASRRSIILRRRADCAVREAQLSYKKDKMCINNATH